MIQDECQYTVTQTKLQELKQGLAELNCPDLNLHPRQLLARCNSFHALIAKLQQEIDEYNQQKPAIDWRDCLDTFCQSPADQRLGELLQNLFTTSEIRQHQTRQRLYRIVDNTALLGHVKKLAQKDPCAAAILDEFWPWLFQNNHAAFRPEPARGLCQSFLNYLHDHLEQQLGYLDHPKNISHFANQAA